MLFRRSTSWYSSTTAMSWRGVSRRFSTLIFAGFSVFLICFSKSQPEAVSYIRSRTIDTMAPVLDFVAKPATVIQNAGQSFRDFALLRVDNKKLKEENAHMIEWQNAVALLEKENRELRALMNFKAEIKTTYISARVIADTGGAYSRGLIVTAGKSDGVREGMAAVTGEGLVGQVVEVGEGSSRILLVSDMNSRIPITIAETGDRAILAGDNSARPKILFLARDASVSDGAHVVTSGFGGVFPPNLPIGILKESFRGAYKVLPMADLGRITYVRLVDFGLGKKEFDKVEIKSRAESIKK